MPVPTRRLLLVALAGLIPVVVTGSYQLGLAAGAAWLLATALAGWIDSRFAAPLQDLDLRRMHDDKLSLGVWNVVTLSLTNRTARPLTFQVRDSVPRWLIPKGNTSACTSPSDDRWQLEYTVFPLHRGDYSFGPATIRVLGPLGLAWRQHSTLAGDVVKVYPNLLAIRSYEALAARGMLEEVGMHNSRRWGEGTEIERLRDYTPDDELRRVHWKATARHQRPIAVEYETERSQNVIIMLDCGRLMSTRLALKTANDAPASGNGQPPALTRLDHALNAATLLSFVGQSRGDRFGLLAFSDRVLRYVPPGRGRPHFLSIVSALYNLEPEPVEPDVREALTYLEARSPRRSLMVLFTDLAEPDAAAALAPSMAYLARRHLPLVVTLRDPDIEHLADRFPAKTADVYERAVARAVLEERERILTKLRHVGVLTLDVSADRIGSALVNRYLEIKARRGW